MSLRSACDCDIRALLTLFSMLLLARILGYLFIHVLSAGEGR